MSTVFETSELPAVSTLSRDDFNNEYIARSRPLKLAGMFRDWPPVKKWTPDYLRRAIGTIQCDVETRQTPLFDLQTEPTLRRMTVAQYLDWVHSPEPPTEYYYLFQRAIFGEFFELAEDIAPPALIPLDRHTKTYINLWMGRAGTITPLHHDKTTNLLMQVAGTKRLILFAPQHNEHLYPHEKGTRAAHMSRVDIDNPDLAQFPLFAQARALETTLEPGDALFIPTLWWHQVYTITSGLSVNIWWSPRQ